MAYDGVQSRERRVEDSVKQIGHDVPGLHRSPRTRNVDLLTVLTHRAYPGVWSKSDYNPSHKKSEDDTDRIAREYDTTVRLATVIITQAAIPAVQTLGDHVAAAPCCFLDSVQYLQVP